MSRAGALISLQSYLYRRVYRWRLYCKSGMMIESRGWGCTMDKQDLISASSWVVAASASFGLLKASLVALATALCACPMPGDR